MNAQEIFANQLGDNRLYTSKMLHEAVQTGQVVEGSDTHQRRLKHVGERIVYAFVYRVDEEADCGEHRFLRAAAELYFESEIEMFVQRIQTTHYHNGYVGTNASVPRFMLKRKDNAAAKVYN